MYRQSFFDFEAVRAVAPIFICEECGDMVLNLNDLGFYYDFGDGIRAQWLEYLREYEPDNPAVRKCA